MYFFLFVCFPSKVFFPPLYSSWENSISSKENIYLSDVLDRAVITFYAIIFNVCGNDFLI